MAVLNLCHILEPGHWFWILPDNPPLLSAGVFGLDEFSPCPSDRRQFLGYRGDQLVDEPTQTKADEPD